MLPSHRGRAAEATHAIDGWTATLLRVEFGGKEVIEKPCSASSLSSVRIADATGQGLAEYALILALIAIIAIVALLFLGGQISTILSTVGNSV